MAQASLEEITLGLMVDEATKYKKSFFLKRKKDQVEVIIDELDVLFSFLRCCCCCCCSIILVILLMVM